MRRALCYTLMQIADMTIEPVVLVKKEIYCPRDSGCGNFWFLVLIGMFIMCFGGGEVRANSSNAGILVSNSKAWLGNWYREDSTQFSQGQISIQPASKGRVHFSILVFDGAQNGEVEGIARLRPNLLIWHSPMVAAQFTFLLRDNKLTVSTNGEANYYAGYGVSFDGVYSRQQFVTPDHPLTELGIFKSDSEEDGFQTLVGPVYDLFVSSMQIIHEESDAQTHDCWYTGFVRGFASDRAAIIEIHTNGRISAAVMDESSATIRYFCNCNDKPDRIPKAIGEWIDEHSWQDHIKIIIKRKP